MRVGRARHNVRGHGYSTGPKGAANVDLGGALHACLRGMTFEERPTRRTRRTLPLDYVGLVSRTDASTVRGVFVIAIGDWCPSRPNVVPTLAESRPYACRIASSRDRT